MADTKQVIVEMERVSFTYNVDKGPVLRDISLRIARGEWVSIVGRNGSGKSSLVRLLNGLLTASAGRIVIGGLPLDSDQIPLVRQQIGYVFQNPDNQFVGLSVLDELAFGLENLGLDRSVMQERVKRYAEQLQITHLLDRHPGQLSGGQKQRVAVASILAMEPEIIVLDEATSMLDEKSKTELLALFRELKASGRYTIIAVTHDTEEMLASDRLLALADGTIAAQGAPQELLVQDELMAACGIRPPFLLRLSRLLGGLLPDGATGKTTGAIDISSATGTAAGNQAAFDEEQLVEALWESYLSE